jgi:hypothetical protein
MPVIFKAIEPKKFKIDAFEEELRQAAKVVEQGILKDYKAGVRDWDTKVDFNAETAINPNGGISIAIDTDNEIYTYVHEGTGPHDIRPRNVRQLRFQNTYTAKTIPGVIQSRRGGPSGDFVFSGRVRHPGFPGRFFSKPIKAKWGPFFQRQIDRAFKSAVRKSGHEI